MEDNTVTIWWYWWGRSRHAMDTIDSTDTRRETVTFSYGDLDGEEDEVHQDEVRRIPMTDLPAYATTGGMNRFDNGTSSISSDNNTNKTSRGNSGSDDDDDDILGNSPYNSRYLAWRAGLSAGWRRSVDVETARARHCSALLYRGNRGMWNVIDRELSASVADLLRAGVAEGRIEPHVVDGEEGGAVLHFTRVGRRREFVSPAPLSADDCHDIILNNRRAYTPVSLRQIPLTTKITCSLTKAGRARRRGRRYRAPLPPSNPSTTGGANTVPLLPPRMQQPSQYGGGEEETSDGSIDRQRSGIDPIRLWPRASYIKDMTTYL